MSVPRFERLFREVAGLDVDKSDLKRCNDFINDKIYHMLLIGQAHAKANERDVLLPWDLPITKGLQERMHEFRDVDQDIELRPTLEELTARPPLEVALSDDTTERIALVAAGLCVALAQCMVVVDPEVKNPGSEHWRRAEQIFNILL